MKTILRIGLVGDHDPSVIAHRAIPVALRLAADAGSTSAEPTWLPTEQIRRAEDLSGFDGLWCVPATPYRSMNGALLAIRHAREQRVPFLGTCGGFQHAIIEYARNVLGWVDADHAETSPGAALAVISPLECPLVEVSGTVHLLRGSRISRAYGAAETTEGYHCRYGLNRRFRESIGSGPLTVSAVDAQGDVRAVELEGHPFFLATLFQPERAGLSGKAPPLVAEFLRSCADV